jgi:hypothetical protein
VTLDKAEKSQLVVVKSLHVDVSQLVELLHLQQR